MRRLILKTVLRGVFLLLLIVVLGMVAGAQDDWPYEPVYEGLQIGDMEWMPDSLGLIFSNYDYNTHREEWFVYTPRTNTVSSDDASTPANVFQMLTDNTPYPLYGGQNYVGTVYISPNNRFVAYLIKFEESMSDSGFALMNLETGKTAVIEGITLPPAYPALPNLVAWAEGSTAFTINVAVEGAGNWTERGFYVEIVDDNVESVETTLLHDYILYAAEDDIYSGLYEDIGYEIQNVTDLDATGQFLLVSAFRPSQETWHLLIIDMKTLAVEVVANIDAIGAAGIFQQPSNLKIIYTTAEGFFEYDRSTKKTRQLSVGISPDQASIVHFSPDGQFIAFRRESDTKNLYVLPLNP